MPPGLLIFRRTRLNDLRLSRRPTKGRVAGGHYCPRPPKNRACGFHRTRLKPLKTDVAALSPGLRAPPLPATHAWVGYGWQNNRLYHFFRYNGYTSSLVSHDARVRPAPLDTRTPPRLARPLPSPYTPPPARKPPPRRRRLPTPCRALTFKLAAYHQRLAPTTSRPASTFSSPDRPLTSTAFPSHQRAPCALNRHPLGLAQPPGQARPSPPSHLPPAPSSAVNLTGFAGTCRPAAPQAPQSSPRARCLHRPSSPPAHRRPQPDQHNLTTPTRA